MRYALIGLAVLMQAQPTLAASQSPIVVQQTSPHNILRAIEQQSSVMSINRSQTVTQGDTTVTEIIAIGPDPAPLAASQTGQVNKAIAFQQGSDPKIDLQQQGTRNISRTTQLEIP